jgi:hypothetical protein
MRKIMILILVLTSMAYSRELPIALYTEHDNLVLQDTIPLRDSLGINYIYGTVDYSAITPLKNAGLGLIKWGGTGWNDINYLSGKSYFAVAANDFNSFPRFTVHRGSASGNFWTNDSSGVKLSGPILDGFWFYQYDRSGFWGEGPRDFYANIRMAINPTNMTGDSLIGIIYIHRYDGNNWLVRDSILVYPDSNLLAGGTVYVPSNPRSFTLGEDGCLSTYQTKYSFSASGKMIVYLDTLKCYDIEGLRVTDGYYNQRIADSVNASPYNQIDY